MHLIRFDLSLSLPRLQVPNHRSITVSITSTGKKYKSLIYFDPNIYEAISWQCGEGSVQQAAIPQPILGRRENNTRQSPNMGKQYLSVYTTCFFSCSLPTSTKYRTSSTFWYLTFYNVILELCLRLFSSPWRLLHSANEEELSQSFKALRKLTLPISQKHNITLSHALEIIIDIISTNIPNNIKFLLISFQSAI